MVTFRDITPSFRGHQRWRQQLIISLLGLVLALGLGGWLTPAAAQLPNLFGPAGTTGPPANVQRVGQLEVTTVTLDGTDLFKIASPAVFNRNDPAGALPVEVRAREIENNLRQAIAHTLMALEDEDPADSEEFTIQVLIRQLDGQPVLLATSPGIADPKALLTVTTADAQYYGLSSTVLAETWQERLQNTLQRSLDSRRPDAFRHHLRQTIWISLASILATLILVSTWQFITWRLHKLKQLHADPDTDLANPLNPSKQPSLTPPGPQKLHYQLSLEQKIQGLSFFRWLLFWVVAFVWIAGLSAVLYVFPQTRGYAVSLFSTPLLLLVTWFIAGLLNRLANLGIDRITRAWSQNELGDFNDLQRRSMRISTITAALKGLKTAVIYILAILWVLQVLRIAPASLLAFGALAALAVSFGAQNLMRDLVNGFLILLEDQYAIGDFITTSTAIGIVENLNLRITQVRGPDGRLITLPNSLINQVDNLSRTWSRVDLTIDVAYDTDIDHALRVVRHVSHTLAADPLWQQDILDPTEMVGVEAVTHAGISIRIWIRTRPLRQFPVAREYRRRLRLAFEQEGITIGMPQQVFVERDANQEKDSLPSAAGDLSHDNRSQTTQVSPIQIDRDQVSRSH
ncbi:MAG: mechanosensitive ion channel family protein [Leptolyngbya sp. LCM1.Bin17]|nr:MAG: mechanosensitive ion channel family protein [Leptolyngbya sp. LCM1.Bin17]